jgi:hypothetical protein
MITRSMMIEREQARMITMMKLDTYAEVMENA